VNSTLFNSPLVEEPARPLALGLALTVLLLQIANDRQRRSIAVCRASATQRLGDARPHASAKRKRRACTRRREPACRPGLCRLETLLDRRELRLESVLVLACAIDPCNSLPFFITTTYRWFAAVSFSWLSWSRLSSDWMRSLRAMSLRSAIATSFLSELFCSTSCLCTTVSCSRLRSRNIIFFCCARLFDVRSTLLYCSRVSSRDISSSTTWGADVSAYLT
jgi:hypothetical protein